MRIVGSGSPFAAEPEEQLESHANYLIGLDPAGWRTNVPQYGKVRVREVLPGTDIVYYGNRNRLEFDLLLQPGADAGRIRLRFSGEGIELHVDQAGDLILKTRAGELIQHRPNIQQEGKRVPGNFHIDANGDVGFELGPYDHARSLSIDPVVSYLTYLGGTADDSINAITVDSSGNAYIAGATSSSNFPVTTGAMQTAFPPTSSTVAFVTKLNAAGTGLVYTTFLGGSGINSGDSANAIAVDGSGNAYVAGTTGSANFPVIVGSLSTSLSGATDAFVAKINATGTALVYSTYLGGSAKESAYGIAVDSSGDAYVTGTTGSTNFPVTTGVPQSTLKSANDAFVAKLNPLGKALVYSTYLGGSAEDDAYGIVLDSSGNAYVTGSTASTDFPTTSAAFQKTIGPATVAFVAKVNAAGTALGYSTFLGGTGGDSGNAIAVDGSGAAYVAGTTFSADFPTTAGVFSGGAPGNAVYGHAFVTKVNTTGAGLVYSTYLGGSSSEGANGLALDASLDAIVVGFTDSLNFPVTASPADPVANYSSAAFLAKINPTATAISYSTLLGASGSTVAQSVAMDSTSHAYVAGYTGSSTLPASAGAFQAYNATLSPQANTGFVAKLDLGSAVVCSLSFSPTAVSLPVSGGAAMASVVAPAGCAWEAIPGGSWLTVSLPSSGVGPGTVSVTAGSNAMSLNSRLSTVNAGAAMLTVTQSAGSCGAPQFYPATQTIAAAGGTGSVAVALPAGCTVTATSTASWITINSGATGSGDDLVTFTVAANSGSARSGTITIAGTAYTIGQVGTLCVTSLTPGGSSIAATGGSLTASLAAPAGCGWTVASSGSWLTVSPVSGTGNATLTLTAVANSTGAARSANVTSAGFSFSVTQGGAMPSVVSVTPPSGTGNSQVFTAVFADSAGASYLNDRNFLVNSILNAAVGCYIVVLPTGTYLVSDSGASIAGPLTASGTLSNGQCTLNGSGSSVTNSGNTSTVTLSITFAASFAGAKSLYMNAGDVYGNHSGWQTMGAYTVTGGNLATTSITPSSGTGNSQVFTAVFTDSSGASYLNDRNFLINSILNAAVGCYAVVLPSGTYLVSDSGASIAGPLTASGTLSNSQCTLNGSGSSVTNSGNTSTVKLSITFAASFAGAKSLYMNAGDLYGNHSGWQTMGAYTVTGGALSTTSVAPSSGTGNSQVFTAVFADSSGASYLNDRNFLINSILNAAVGCYVVVLPAGTYLVSDSGASLAGPLTASGSLSNSQCTLNGSGSSVTNSGNTSTVTMSITFAASFAGAKNLYMNAGDIYGNHSGWQTMGSYTVAGGALATTSVAPSSGSGNSQAFTAVFTDSSGASYLNDRNFLINSILNAAVGCYVVVLPAGTYLIGDSGASMAGPLTASGTLSNSQCTLSGSGTSVTNSGGTSTVTLSITFAGSFAGPKNVYMNAGDLYGNHSGWQTMGTYTVH